MSRDRLRVSSHAGVLGSIADHRRLSRAASTVESAVNTADRRWVADLYAATGAVEVSVLVEFDTWRSAPWRAEKSPAGTAGISLDFEVNRESVPLLGLDAGLTSCWLAQLTVEVLYSVAARYKLPPPPTLPAWTLGNRFALRQVYAVGATGAPDRPWHRNPDVDAWLHRSRLVCDTLTDQLALHPPSPSASPELTLRVRSATTPSVEVPESGGWATITVPKGFAQLEEVSQRELVTDMVIDAAGRRGHRDGFIPQPALAQTRAILNSADPTFRRTGPVTAQVGGHHQARWQFEEDWSGLGRLQLQITDPTGRGVAASSWVPAGPTPAAAGERGIVFHGQKASLEYPHLRGRLDEVEADLANPFPPGDNSFDGTADSSRAEVITTHPRFSRHFTDPLYTDDGNDLSPFGSDEGADILAGWLNRTEQLDRTSTVRTILAADTDDVDELINNLHESQPDLDAIIIGAAFTLLRLTGHIDDEGRRWTTDALERTHRYYDNPEARQMLTDLHTFTD